MVCSGLYERLKRLFPKGRLVAMQPDAKTTAKIESLLEEKIQLLKITKCPLQRIRIEQEFREKVLEALEG